MEQRAKVMKSVELGAYLLAKTLLRARALATDKLDHKKGQALTNCTY